MVECLKMSSFVEKAAEEAASAAVIPGCAQAGALLAEARAHIYHWPLHFPGFSAQLLYTDGERQAAGRLRSTESRRIELGWEQEFDTRWVRFQLEELLSHREHPEKSKIASPTGVEMGDHCPIYGQKISFLGDKMGSFYRIRDQRITTIGRAYQGTEFVIHIDRHANFGTADKPRYAALDYAAFYWSAGEHTLVKAETYRDRYQQVGDHWLPASRRVTVAEDGGMVVRQLDFQSPRLLTGSD